MQRRQLLFIGSAVLALGLHAQAAGDKAAHQAEAEEPEAVLDQVEHHMPAPAAAQAARTDQGAPNMPLPAAR